MEKFGLLMVTGTDLGGGQQTEWQIGNTRNGTRSIKNYNGESYSTGDHLLCKEWGSCCMYMYSSH